MQPGFNGYYKNIIGSSRFSYQFHQFVSANKKYWLISDTKIFVRTMCLPAKIFHLGTKIKIRILLLQSLCLFQLAVQKFFMHG